MQYKSVEFVGLDLDGTLLTPDKTITSETKALIQQCAEKGITLVPITGRPAKGLPECVKENPNFHYAITSNGAVVQDLTNETTLATHRIPSDITSQMIAVTQDFDVDYEIFQNGYGYTTQNTYDQLRKKYMGTPLLSYITDSRKPLHDLDSLFALCQTPIEGISILCKQRKIRNNILEQLSRLPDIQIVYPNPLDLEINHSTADKGQAMLALAKSLDIAPETILAIGDSDNDRSMLLSAGISVAMGNATAQLRAIAQYTTADNTQNGVAMVLKDLLSS